MADERLQRRLAAILAADVVGYSRLMEADEANTLSRLKALRRELFEPKTKQYGGRIFKTTGDGALVEFKSAVDAVNSAVEIQRVLADRDENVSEEQRIQLRIGVSLGDVIVEGTDLYGNGVNVASRMEGLASPGGVCISGNVYEHVQSAAELAFDDLGEQNVKNIDRPVHAFRVRDSSGDNHEGASALSLPDKPSIAVLPFDNMSGDPEQTYFTDGITEDIITELSRFRSLFVIARNSSFALRGKAIDVTEVGRQLGVRYVVEGSVRKSANRVRVTVQLIDATTGHHLWAERYDRELEDIFEVQDEITRAIVSALPGRLEEAGREHAERKQTSSITAYDFVLLSNQRWRRFTREGFAEAREFCRNAIALDPQYARAHTNIAWTHVCDEFMETPDVPLSDEAVASIQTALKIDESDAWTHGAFAQLLFLLRKDQEAENHFRRALALNSNDADVAAVYANILVYWGRSGEALEWIETAKRLNPFPPDLYHWYHALALFSARQYEDAVRIVREIGALDRWCRGLLAACFVYLGRLDEAIDEAKIFVSERQDELREQGKLVPDNTLELAYVRADRYRDQADREHLLDGLRKAGLSG